MTVGAGVLVVALVTALGYGLWRARSDGRFRGAERPSPSAPRSDRAPDPSRSVVDGTAFADRLGERATLLQFSSAFCAPCRVTRQVLAQVSDAEPGVAHVEVDAEQHLDLVRRVGVLRTPTTLVLDAAGREVTRAGGAPRRDQVRQALALAGVHDVDGPTTSRDGGAS